MYRWRRWSSAPQPPEGGAWLCNKSYPLLKFKFIMIHEIFAVPPLGGGGGFHIHSISQTVTQ